MDFKNIDISIKYRSASDDILKKFYIPVLKHAIEYKRAVGYFSSKVLVNLIEGIYGLTRNNGNIKLIISPFVSSQDAEAFLNIKDDTHKEAIHEKLENLFDKFTKGERKEFISTQILVALINEGYLSLKVAIPKRREGIFHEKIGVFVDSFYNKIAISGSNNETQSALMQNIESFSAFKSWIEGQKEYVFAYESDIDNYWANTDSEIETIDIHDAVEDKILEPFESDKNLDDLYAELQTINEEKAPYKSTKLQFTPYDFQREAANKWLENERGIFKFATGTGKTKTAIHLMNELFLNNEKAFYVIVLPDKTLINQWEEELRENKFDPILCYSGNPSWGKGLGDAINYYKYEESNLEVVLVTKQTLFKDKFQKHINRLKNDYVFIADECHRLGTENLLRTLPDVRYRLGLSATPEVYFSEDKTQRLMEYFGGIIAEYNLKDAIQDNFLVPYEYHPVVVKLTDNEKEDYDEQTKKIVKVLNHDDENKVKELDVETEQLFFKRARILYGAHNKINIVKNLASNLAQNKHLLIYCGATSKQFYEEDNDTIDEHNREEALSQLEKVNQTLNLLNIKAVQYTQEEDEHQRKRSINFFKEGKISTLVAIKCLDEGVNIPEIKQAIILASSGNPREFVQRRGRLLRKSAGKDRAVIYDAVIFDDSEKYQSINRVELKRVKEFSKIALNASEVYDEYKEYFDKYLEDDENE